MVLDFGELEGSEVLFKIALSYTTVDNAIENLNTELPHWDFEKIRIKRATQLIETGEFNMTQISYMVGINDPRYFSKCFKAQVGMTPTEYKEKVGR